jgi:hypothetical protein
MFPCCPVPDYEILVFFDVLRCPSPFPIAGLFSGGLTTADFDMSCPIYSFRRTQGSDKLLVRRSRGLNGEYLTAGELNVLQPNVSVHDSTEAGVSLL